MTRGNTFVRGRLEVNLSFGWPGEPVKASSMWWVMTHNAPFRIRRGQNDWPCLSVTVLWFLVIRYWYGLLFAPQWERVRNKIGDGNVLGIRNSGQPFLDPFTGVIVRMPR